MDNSGLGMEVNENLSDLNLDITQVAIQQLTSDLNSATPKSKPVIEMDSSSTVKTSGSNIIQNANNKVLIDVLSPQVEENEKTKRIHKYILLAIVGVFIVIQFVLTFYLISITYNFIFDTYRVKGAIDTHLINLLFTFLTGYITSVVVELIYMLKFMVQNVFDTSISDLVKLFKEDGKK